LTAHHRPIKLYWEDSELRFPFIPKEEKFFDLLEESARNMVLGATKLAELIERWDNVPERVQEIKKIEHNGDEITHRIFAQLHATFVTPIDREDIANLAEHLDDVLDFIEETASSMLIYWVAKPTEKAQELAKIIVTMATEISEAIPRLRHRKQMKGLPQCCMEINRLENEADAIVRSTVAGLFHDNDINVVDVIKWREIYEYMETATDRCEDIANVLEAVMIKRA
jgi:predicted phosphate transport protein (TIGR00153 family)